MKKLFFPALLLLALLVATCTGRDYSYLYKTYKGTELYSDKVAEENISMTADIVVTVKPAGIIEINGLEGTYKIIKDKPMSILRSFVRFKEKARMKYNHFNILKMKTNLSC